jgi:predicted Na+-dependent transporter
MSSRPKAIILILFVHTGATGFLGVTAFDHSTAAPLMRAVAGRNLASGVVMAVLTLTGQTKTAGTMMLCGLITQLCDILACARIDGNWKGHAFLAPFTAALGWWVMTT